jgi:hypothetical protein
VCGCNESLALPLGLGHAHTAPDGDPSGIQVDVPPPQRQRHTAPHSGERHQPPTHAGVGVRNENKIVAV